MVSTVSTSTILSLRATGSRSSFLQLILAIPSGVERRFMQAPALLLLAVGGLRCFVGASLSGMVVVILANICSEREG